jgi:hypothetical protein
MWNFRFVDRWGLGEAPPFADGDLLPNRDRAICFLVSSSAQPVLTVSGGNAQALVEIDSPSPTNFGGDGHTWWGAWYITPTSHVLDFTGTTGVQRFILFMRAGSDLNGDDGAGTYGDGVDVSWGTDLEYNGSMFGHATEIATADQTSRLNDLIGIWCDSVVRSIDDINIYKDFYYAPDSSIFDDSYHFHNAQPIPFEPDGGPQSSISWCQGAPGGDATFVLDQMVDAVASDFPGACRVLSIVSGFRVRALCSTVPEA